MDCGQLLGLRTKVSLGFYSALHGMVKRAPNASSGGTHLLARSPSSRRRNFYLLDQFGSLGVKNPRDLTGIMPG